MARDALEAFGLELTVTDDQGSLRADIRALLRSIRRALRHPPVRRIVPDVNAELARSAEFATLVQPFQHARRAHGDTLLRRAIARGELPETLDFELANDLLAAPLYWRMLVTPRKSDAAYLDRLAGAIVAALSAAA